MENLSLEHKTVPYSGLSSIVRILMYIGIAFYLLQLQSGELIDTDSIIGCAVLLFSIMASDMIRMLKYQYLYSHESTIALGFTFVFVYVIGIFYTDAYFAIIALATYILSFLVAIGFMSSNKSNEPTNQTRTI